VRARREKKRIVKIVFGKRIKLSFFCQAKDNTHTYRGRKCKTENREKYEENEENAAGEDI